MGLMFNTNDNQHFYGPNDTDTDTDSINASLKAISMVLLERGRQNDKWGTQDHSNGLWLTILSEEIGEVSTEMLSMINGKALDHENLKKEVVQICAVALAWVESLNRQKL